MKIKRFKGFTLFEILIVLFIIALLTTLVTVSVTAVMKKSRDDRRITDANSFASALDQYANERKRKYPVLNSGSCLSTLDADAYCAIEITSTNAALIGFLGSYLNPLPQDPKKKAGSTEYRYVYVYRRDGLKAAVIIDKMEGGTNLCNVPSNISLRPVSVQKYISGETEPVKGISSPCYYVAR
jgi:prepilin-type N-terminal cleavage/methylation domain-containing protein